MAKDFNKSHPELKQGEIFITNIYPDRVLGNQNDWEVISWKTKRAGEKAYDINGGRMEDMRPVFAQRSELEKAGVDTHKM